MARLVDTHAHLNAPDFAGDLEKVLARARQAGVAAMLDVGTGIESSRRSISLSLKYPQIKAAVGFHPQTLPGDLLRL